MDYSMLLLESNITVITCHILVFCIMLRAVNQCFWPLCYCSPVKKLLDLCSVQEEEGEVTKQMHQGGVLVAVVWEGEAIKMVVTTTEQEAMVSISVLSDRTKVIREWSVKRMNHSAWTWVFWSEGYTGFLSCWFLIEYFPLIGFRKDMYFLKCVISRERSFKCILCYLFLFI